MIFFKFFLHKYSLMPFYTLSYANVFCSSFHNLVSQFSQADISAKVFQRIKGNERKKCNPLANNCAGKSSIY